MLKVIVYCYAYAQGNKSGKYIDRIYSGSDSSHKGRTKVPLPTNLKGLQRSANITYTSDTPNEPSNFL